MNLPPSSENKSKSAKTVDDLKKAIADILEERDFGILSEHERRIEELEKKK